MLILLSLILLSNVRTLHSIRAAISFTVKLFANQIVRLKGEHIHINYFHDATYLDTVLLVAYLKK